MCEKVRVLVVDDEKAFAETLSDILEIEGYDAVVANTGEDAVLKAKETKFDVILMDIKLPAMNGVEAYKEIKGVSPGTAVIMMTAYAVGDLLRDAIEEGAYTVIHKPMDMAKVIQAIEGAKAGKKLMLVMILDADIEPLKELKAALEQEGYAVVSARNGEEAIELAKGAKADIIFIDINLPVLNGLETYLELKKNDPGMVAIIMSSKDPKNEVLISEALGSGAYACIYKPVDPKKALAIIKGVAKK